MRSGTFQPYLPYPPNLPCLEEIRMRMASAAALENADTLFESDMRLQRDSNIVVKTLDENAELTPRRLIALMYLISHLGQALLDLLAHGGKPVVHVPPKSAYLLPQLADLLPHGTEFAADGRESCANLVAQFDHRTFETWRLSRTSFAVVALRHADGF